MVLDKVDDIVGEVKAVNGARIRLAAPQWEHIITARPELAPFQKAILEAVSSPDEVFQPLLPLRPQLHAIKKIEDLKKVGLAENLLMVYREVTTKEGFIITAYPISSRRLSRRYKSWRRVYP